MAWSLNRAMIIGNATRDPELRVTPAGQSVASFAVATNRRWKDAQGNLQEKAEFHEVVAWGKLAEIVQQIVHKGNRVYVEGRLQTRSWDGPDGSKRNRTEIVMDNFVPLTPKSGAEALAGIPAQELGDKSEGGEEPLKKSTKSASKPAGSSAKPAKPDDQQTSSDAMVDDINLDDIPF